MKKNILLGPYCICKPSLLSTSLADLFQVGCSAVPLNTPTKLSISLTIRYQIIIGAAKKQIRSSGFQTKRDSNLSPQLQRQA